MKIDTTKSAVFFTIKKLLFITVKGTLPEVKGEIKLKNDTSSESKIELSIPLSGIDTNNKKRNEHLLQKDFFNSEKFPEIRFQSADIQKKNEFYWAKGELSVAGTTNSIEIPFQVNKNKVTGKFNLNRKEFNVGKIPAFVAAENVEISFDFLVE